MQPIGEEGFDEMLMAADGLVLIDFWADWCGPCKAVTPVLEALAPQYEGRVDFYAVNADENRRLMDAFGVRSIPTIIVLEPNQENGGAKVLAHSVGAKSGPVLAKLIDEALNPKPGLMARIVSMFGG